MPVVMFSKVTNVFGNLPLNRSNIYESLSGQILIKLILYLITFLLTGMIHIKVSEENIDYSTEAFLNKIINLLDCCTPF